MANPDYAAGAFMKDRLHPRVLDRLEKDREHDRKLADAYEAVNAREQDICQVSGYKLYPKSDNLRRRREHHHLRGRNCAPEDLYNPARIMLVSAKVHQLLTAKLILIEGEDATQPLTFRWDRSRITKVPMQLAKVK